MTVAVKVHSIKIFSIHVISEHSFEHSLRIDYWNQTKLKIFSQKIRPIVILVEQKSKYSFHTMRSWYLSRVNSCWDNNSGFINFKRSLSLSKDTINRIHPLFWNIPPISNGNKMNFSGLTSFDESLLMKIDVLVILIFSS